ncbi:MAG TPA: glycosyltransferase family 2 protein [Magnetospirillum sp.]|jgi:glycosyltransferase involved in cell wall biosynthesis|nr:glycosyltransferase family 2 protein [Magnetospirillum sp.]
MPEPLPPGFADVSVVMPAYNVAATVGRALASIAAQTLRPREVLVVDDGSSDGTAEAVAAMAGRMNGVRLRLFRQPNQGAGAARNRALAAAEGEWIAFLDSDDEWLPAKLERSIEVTEGADLVMTSHNLFGIDPQGGEHFIDSQARYLANPDDPYRTLFLRGFISSSTVLVRRAAVLEAGGFDPELRSAQDYELWLAILAKAGRRFLTFADPLLRYTLAEDGITSRIGRKYRCSLDILRRHMGVLKRLPGPVLVPLLLRMLIIHVEAVRGHLARGERGDALNVAAQLPWRCLQAVARLPFADGNRPNFLARLSPMGQEVALGITSTP